MGTPNSLRNASAGVSISLTNVAQGFKMPQFVMRALFPLVETGDYDGRIIRFDDAIYEEIDDNRADDTTYPEVQDGYQGAAYSLSIKGFSYRVGDKKAKKMERMNINWGRRASTRMIQRAGLKHEIESAAVAVTPANYAAGNQIALAGAQQFNDPSSNPGTYIRAGRSAIAQQIGVDPNVMVMGREVFDTIQENELIKDRLKHTTRDSLTTEMLANFYGFDEVRVCSALVKRANGTKEYVFGKNLVMAYTNPSALRQDRLPFRTTGTIDQEEPSYGYTYTYMGNPQVFSPYRDDDRGATVYKLDFDRSVQAVGVNDANLITHGYLISNAVA